MSLPHEIGELIERFDRNVDEYRSGQYNETQLRRDFLDPFFEALGWDVNNRKGYGEAYRDVVHEDAIKIGGHTKAPDYGFYAGPARKFFVEAKKPSVNVKRDMAAAFQLRRYGWSAKLPLSILTNFDEFAVYDCRQLKPASSDGASTARILYYTYKDYAEKWDEITGIFSRDAVWKGTFDKYAEQKKGRRGTAEVDDAFLEEIESWRKTLASNIYLRNPELTTRELNFAVGLIIDRIIFLRICEDRGIEPDEQLKKLIAGKNVYAELLGVFYRADQKYNSGLFHFEEEKNRGEAPDTLTPKLTIDDKVLKDIFRNIYLPVSPYEFSVLPADILGQVYEQFLGKVIHLTAHRAEVQDKPEVRKAGGVYYTPTYIVAYIVENTVGKLCEGKTPKQVDKLRILDPACGSGSFLIGAYQYLLDWYRAWYVNDGADKHLKQLTKGASGEWHLTTAEKRRILLNNIYGVDIDFQAVEVTKLSLLLKVLEGESERSLAKQLTMLHERALPDLGSNIKCGNSLIGTELYEYREMNLFGDDELDRINPFDWNKGFSEIIKAGGFDAVIGNPPYIRTQTMKEWSPLEVEFYKYRYASAKKGNYDIYVVFAEKGLSLLNPNGKLGFILPHKFFNAQYGEPLREMIAQGKHLDEVVHFGHQQVFADATTYTCLLFLNEASSDIFRVVKVDDLEAWQSVRQAVEGTLSAINLTGNQWSFDVGAGSELSEKLSKIPTKLGEIAHLFVGLQTDGDDVFILEEIEKNGERVLCQSKATGSQHWFENDHLKPFLKGSLNIRRYRLSNASKRLIFPYETKNGKSVLIDLKDYKQRYPLTWTYLEMNRARLSARNKGTNGKRMVWIRLQENHTRFNEPKLLVPSIATGSCFAADLDGQYYFVGSGGGGGGGYGVTLKENSKYSYLYLLGVLNSHLLSTHLKTISTPFRGGYIALNRQYIEQLPIRPINFSDPSDKARHDRMVEMVERMLALHTQKAAARTDQEQTMIERRIEATDAQIDRLVYELYELTAEEIKIVEEATR